MKDRKQNGSSKSSKAGEREVSRVLLRAAGRRKAVAAPIIFPQVSRVSCQTWRPSIKNRCSGPAAEWRWADRNVAR